jgi:hypothetical protein
LNVELPSGFPERITASRSGARFDLPKELGDDFD